MMKLEVANTDATTPADLPEEHGPGPRSSPSSHWGSESSCPSLPPMSGPEAQIEKPPRVLATPRHAQGFSGLLDSPLHKGQRGSAWGGEVGGQSKQQWDQDMEGPCYLVGWKLWGETAGFANA